MTFEETLAEWMPSQRWFAGKGARILDLAIVTATELVGGDPGLHHLIVAVTQGSPFPPGGTGALGSTVDSYQLFLGLREEIPGHLQHVQIGVADDGRIAYDALHDRDLTHRGDVEEVRAQLDGDVRMVGHPRQPRAQWPADWTLCETLPRASTPTTPVSSPLTVPGAVISARSDW